MRRSTHSAAIVAIADLATLARTSDAATAARPSSGRPPALTHPATRAPRTTSASLSPPRATPTRRPVHPWLSKRGRAPGHGRGRAPYRGRAACATRPAAPRPELRVGGGASRTARAERLRLVRRPGRRDERRERREGWRYRLESRGREILRRPEGQDRRCALGPLGRSGTRGRAAHGAGRRVAHGLLAMAPGGARR